MKLSMPNGFGVLGASVVGMMLMIPSEGVERQVAGGSRDTNRQARAADSGAVPDIPVFVDLPESKSSSR